MWHERWYLHLSQLVIPTMNRSLRRGNGVQWYLWLLVLCGVLVAGGCVVLRENPFLKGLGSKAFEQTGPVTVYNNSSIFDYINGEAEVYLPLGFQLLYVLSYQKLETEALIVVDAYDMGTSVGAQGIFKKYTAEGGSAIQGLGESAWTDTYLVLFRRGKYFLRVSPHPTPDSGAEPVPQDMLKLSRALDEALKGALP